MMRFATPALAVAFLAAAFTHNAAAPNRFRPCAVTLEGHGPLTIATMTCGDR